MLPKVSIITVCYNAGDALKATLSAIHSQTYLNKEVIVIDGGSTDGSLNNLGNLFIDTLVSEPDKGIYDAMNKGLSLATGAYVWFMNAGDVPADNCVLADLIGSAKSFPDLIYGKTQTVLPDGALKEVVVPPVPLKQYQFAADMVVNHQSLLVKRDGCPIFDAQFRIIGDQKWLYDLLDAHPRQCYVDLLVCRYVLGGVSDTGYNRLNNEKIRFLVHGVRFSHKPVGLLRVLLFGYVWQAVRRVKKVLI